MGKGVLFLRGVLGSSPLFRGFHCIYSSWCSNNYVAFIIGLLCAPMVAIYARHIFYFSTVNMMCVLSSTLAVVQKHQPGSNGETGLFGELKRVFSELLSIPDGNR